MESERQLPIEVFANQVGGHTFELQNQGILHQGSFILKQLQDQGRGSDKEVTFYQTIEKEYPELCKWIAGYHGIKHIDYNGIKGDFMALDDLTYGYKKPCVMDLKMGVKTWEEDAPIEKIERESKKYPLQRTIGFRLTGMRVFNKEKREYDVYNKKFGYSLTEETIHSIFDLFFGQVPSSRRIAIVQSVLDQLRSILQWFEVPGRLLFICMSFLFILEGDGEEYNPVVRLVDFAHVKQLPLELRDEGCITGIKTIIAELERMVAALQ